MTNEPDADRKPPKVISPSDPCSAWTAKANKRVQFGYGLNYLIDIENAVIVDVEATPARTYDEVAADQDHDRAHRSRFGLKPKRLAADTAYGTGKFLGWLVGEGDHTAYPGVGQEQARRRHLLTRRLHLRQGEQRLHLPEGQVAHDDRRFTMAGPCSIALASAQLRVCPLKSQVLSEHALAQGSPATSTRTPAMLHARIDGDTGVRQIAR